MTGRLAASAVACACWVSGCAIDGDDGKVGEPLDRITFTAPEGLDEANATAGHVTARAATASYCIFRKGNYEAGGCVDIGGTRKPGTHPLPVEGGDTVLVQLGGRAERFEAVVERATPAGDQAYPIGPTSPVDAVSSSLRRWRVTLPDELPPSRGRLTFKVQFVCCDGEIEFSLRLND